MAVGWAAGSTIRGRPRAGTERARHEARIYAEDPTEAPGGEGTVRRLSQPDTGRTSGWTRPAGRLGHRHRLRPDAGQGDRRGPDRPTSLSGSGPPWPPPRCSADDQRRLPSPPRPCRRSGPPSWTPNWYPDRLDSPPARPSEGGRGRLLACSAGGAQVLSSTRGPARQLARPPARPSTSRWRLAGQVFEATVDGFGVGSRGASGRPLGRLDAHAVWGPTGSSGAGWTRVTESWWSSANGTLRRDSGPPTVRPRLAGPGRRRLVAHPAPGDHRPGGGASGGSGPVTSPMPGTVLAVHVHPGQAVPPASRWLPSRP